jgi:hypothetical protein
MSPKRIQLRRTKGWRKPPSAVVVARPSPWGNPFTVEFTGSRAQSAASFRTFLRLRRTQLWPPGWVTYYPADDEIRAALRGKDLACWCLLDQPCHADVLLEIANSPEGAAS